MTPVLVRACLNGGRRRQEHLAVPLTPDELAADARRVVAEGAGALHVHPRGPDGAEALDPEACGAVVAALRAACPGVGVGLTTGAWIEPDSARRLSKIEAWSPRPDFASVNFSEPGAADLCALLLRLGIGFEAGLSAPADAEALARSGLADRCLRLLVEPDAQEPAAAISAATAIEEVLEGAGLAARRVRHGFARAAWPLLEDALRRGHDIRIGLEDTLELPDGRPARDNANLVACAVRLARRYDRDPGPALR